MLASATPAPSLTNQELTEKVIGCAYRVYNRMGYGFLESVYEKCLTIELRKLGAKVEPQKRITVYYESEAVGEFFADLLVEDVLLVELKSVRTLAPAHESQLVNYLVATNTDIGLLVNFGEKSVEVKRKLRVLHRQAGAGPVRAAIGTQPPPNPVNPVNPV